MRRLAGALALLGLGAAGFAAHAQRMAPEAYPARPIRLLVPFTTGGTADIVARAVAQTYGAQLGQPIVVDNRAGSGGIVGTEIAAQSAKDGYTAMIGNISTIGVSPALYGKLRYDPVRDFTAVTLIASAPFVMVIPPALPAASVKEFIALARSRPKKLNYASTGIGSPGHLAAALLVSSTSIAMEHVPYKGVGPAMLDMFAGEIHVLFLGIGPTQAQVKSGKLRALAVSSAARSPLMPDLPSIAESGVPGFDVTGWYGLFVPAGTPAAIVDKFNAAQRHAASLPELRKQFAALGADLIATDPGQFAAFIRTEMTKWAKVVRDAGIKPE